MTTLSPARTLGLARANATLVVRDTAEAVALLAEHGETAFRIGVVEAGDGPAAAQVHTEADWLA